MLVGIGMSRGELVPLRAVIRQTRRRWPIEQKRRIVEATYAPGASIAQVAREHGVNASQLHSWRRLYPPATLLPVRIVEDSPCVIARPAARPRRAHTAGQLELDTPRGRSPHAADRAGVAAGMTGFPAGAHVWIVAGVTGPRRGFTGLSALAETALRQDPFAGQLFVFRGRRGDLIKVLWWDGDGMCLFAKRLERGRFIWPQAAAGAVALTRAQLSMLLEGIDWRRPARTATPQMAV